MRSALFLLGLSLAAPAVYGVPLTLDFGFVPGAKISFAGDSTFTFTDSTAPLFAGWDFFIGSSTGVGDSVGLLGNISGTWTIGTPVPASGTVQTAPVIGTGTLTIFDGISSTFTAFLTWNDIYSIGTGDGLNKTGGSINLTGLTYTGPNVDLTDLASSPAGVVVANFGFVTSRNVSFLKTNAIQASNYSGQITAVPEPLYSGLALTGALAAALSFARRRINLQS